MTAVIRVQQDAMPLVVNFLGQSAEKFKPCIGLAAVQYVKVDTGHGVMILALFIVCMMLVYGIMPVKKRGKLYQ